MLKLVTSSRLELGGLAAFASGVCGVVAFGFLFAAVMYRGQLTFRYHDAWAALQALFMLPVVYELEIFLRKYYSRGFSPMLGLGVFSLVLDIVFLLLIFFNVLNDALYMVPQGLFGVWLVSVNWRASKSLSRALRLLGMISGVGLVLVGTFPLAYAIFVDSTGFPGPMPEIDTGAPMSSVNTAIHFVLEIGSFTGVATLPIWTLLAGFAFRRLRVAS